MRKYTSFELQDNFITGLHLSKQNCTLSWNLTTVSLENLKASNLPCKDFVPGTGWRDGNMRGSTGQPLSSRSLMESELSPFLATKFLANIP